MTIMHESHQDAPGDDNDDDVVDDQGGATSTPAAPAEPAESPFRKGVEQAGGAVDPDELPPPAPKAEDPPPADADDGAPDDVDDGKPAKPGEQPPPDENGDTPDDEDAEKAAADKAYQENLDKELGELKAGGAKPATLERFKTMSNRIRELELEREEVIPRLTEQAKAAADWEDTVTSTGSNPEQFGRVLGYLHTINKGTREQKLQALQALDKERAWLAQDLGVKTEGYNPLDEHEDLRARVQKGEIDEADALEIAEYRRTKAAGEQQQTQQTAQEQRAQAEQAALQEISAYGVELKAKDPLFAEKLKVLQPAIRLIQERCAPGDWKAEIEKAYKALPKMEPKPQQKPPVTSSPTRPTGGGAMKPEVTSANAFRMGVQAQKDAGR